MTAALHHETDPAQTGSKLLVISGFVLANFGLIALGLVPDLDLAVSAVFFSPPNSFAGITPLARHMRFFAAILPFIVYGSVVLAFLGGLAGLIPAHFKIRHGSFIFLTATLILGPGCS